MGVVFSDTFRDRLGHFGLAAFRPWQIGATLGFVGGMLHHRRNEFLKVLDQLGRRVEIRQWKDWPNYGQEVVELLGRR